MKEIVVRILLIITDSIPIFLSIMIAYWLRNSIDIFHLTHAIPLQHYLVFPPIYIVPLLLFAYEGIYTKRYDFWQETRLILKALIVSFIIVMAYLALTKSIQEYSRFVWIVTFVLMGIFIPLFKRVVKPLLYKVGLWQKQAYLYDDDTALRHEVFGNPYLGYAQAEPDNAQTVFVNAQKHSQTELSRIIDQQLQTNHEVIFIPLLNDYDLTKSQLYELTNTRTNLIGLQNRLKSKYRIFIKTIFDITISILLLPLLLPLMAWIAWMIKREEPNGSILFRQERLGKNGQPFVCYKFRSMYEQSDILLKEYLKNHPEEISYYETYHKYKNDPRITRVGTLLRKTSLDELPQIFNVLKGEMSLVGPRPYLLNEKQKMGSYLPTICLVKPGITGLWQVSGRSEVDFQQRLQMDAWYIRNWSLWLDIIILCKTIKTVLLKEGAY